MANALFVAYKESMLSQGSPVDYDADDIRLIGVDHGTDTPVAATDDFLDDIAAGARVFVSGAFASKTTTGGVADAADVAVSAVSGATVESIVIYKHTGTDSTSRLMVFLDTGTGLPFTPNGGDVTVQWDSGASKIFAI